MISITRINSSLRLGVSLKFGVWNLKFFLPFVLIASNALAASAQSNLETKPLPTLFLIGDSTVNNATKGLQGWGKPIAAMFDTNRINVQNKARGGRSSRTYHTEGLWEDVRKQFKPGDFVLMQFGHNDGGPLANGRARASLKGNGDETREVEDQSIGKKETVHTYGWYLRKYIADTKAAGATPIVLSLVPRNIWNQDKVIRSTNDYGKWAAEAANAGGALFIDLNSIIGAHYEEAGKEKVQQLYFTPADHTHSTPAGAELNAASVVEGIRALTNCPLRDYLLSPRRDTAK